MIRQLIAYTTEIDDAKVAIAEIHEQLNLSALQANTIGIVACHYEFILSGVAAAILKSLPFQTVGTITNAQAVPAFSGPLLFTLTVLTSDDVRFRTAITDSLIGAPDQAIEAAYAEASSGIDEKPALVFSFSAFLLQNSGDAYVETLTRLSTGAPVFGTLAVDDTSTFENSFMLHSAGHARDRMALVLVYGDIHPKFFIATLSKDKILDRPALITASEGHILKQVNGRPVVEYFETLGLTQASETSYAMTTLPFMLDYGDGSPMVSKVFISLNEQKEAICAGVMPEGATLYIGVFDPADVLLTTGNAAADALREAAAGASGMLVYSCISRYMTLGANASAEMEHVRKLTGDTLPFMMAYSGGEICPTMVGDTLAVNRFHNNAFVLCLF